VEISDPINVETRTLVINKLTKAWPHKYDILAVGNEEYAIAEYNRFTLDRIKRLEEEQSKNDDILIQIFDLDRTYKPRRRYMQVQKSKIYDSFIASHTVNGLASGPATSQILDSMDSSSGSWAVEFGSGVSDEAVIVAAGAGSLQVEFDAGGDDNILSNQSYGDISAFTGVSSGLPVSGILKIWVYFTNVTFDLTYPVWIKFGSSASNYIAVDPIDMPETPVINTWYELTYDLSVTVSDVGTPNWAAADYLKIHLSIDGAETIGTMYFDHIRILGSNYSAEILDDMEASAGNWTVTNTGTITNEPTIKIQNAGSLKCDLTSATPNSIQSTQSYGDLSFYTGVNTGTPIQGTIGIWLRFDDASAFGLITNWIQLEIGSSSGNYAKYNGRNYASVDGYQNFGSLTLTTSLVSGTWYYILFDLDSPISVTGTPDWTAVAWSKLNIDGASGGEVGI